MRRLPLAGLGLVLSLSLAVAGCSGDGPDEETGPLVEVSGSFGEEPTLAYDVPLAVDEPLTEVLWEGNGPEVVDGFPVLVHLYSEDARDRSVVKDTYGGVPESMIVDPEEMGPDLYRAVLGRTAGSRVLYVAESEGVPLVVTLDVYASRASGEALQADPGLPAVALSERGAPTVTIPADTPPPADLQVRPLVRGTGAQVQTGDHLVVQYTGVRWSTGEVFDSSWGEGSKPYDFVIGRGSVIQGWDEGLLEQTVGSQVLLVVPPGEGYAGTPDLDTETMVFVVDILYAAPRLGDGEEAGSGDGDLGTGTVPGDGGTGTDPSGASTAPADESPAARVEDEEGGQG